MSASGGSWNSDSFNEQTDQTRPNSLKNRIKQRAMAMDRDDVNEVHVSSVLAAASALASLGNQPAASTPPSTPDITPVAAGGDRTLNLEQMMVTGNSRASPRELDQEVPMTFPQKLMEVLSNSQLSDIITWLPNGKGFIILQKRKFATEVMPMYFKHSKFTSFTRKLNRWGFTRVTRGPESGAYYHKCFQRGQYSLCMQMHCQSKVTPKDSSTTKGSPALFSMKSPGVSSAMSSLQLDESTSTNVASVDPKLSFSTSNPNIFAPDLSCRGSTNNTKPNTQGSFLSAPGRLKAFNLYPQGQSLMMLKNHQEFIRRQMDSHQRSYNKNNLQQGKASMFNQPHGHMDSASLTNHSLLMKDPKNAHRQVKNLSLHSTSTENPTKLPYHQGHQFRPQNSDLFSKTTLERQEQIRQPPMTDRSYLEFLRSKNQSKAGNAFVSELENALADEAKTNNMIKNAMEAQMRSFKERMHREKQAKSGTRSNVENPDSKPAAVKSNFSITQSQVANLRNQSQSAEDRYPKSVRRASAA